MSQVVNTSDLSLTAHQAQDSRGKPTVEVELSLGDIKTIGDVPAGASKGEDEAQTAAVPEAIKAVQEVILPLLRSAKVDLSSHANLIKLDRMMIAKGGNNFRDLPANAVVPVSRALWRAAAKLSGLELYAYIQKNEPESISSGRVHFYMNIFNGGLHALKKDAGEQLGKDRIDIQEIMVVPVAAKTYAEAMQIGERIDQALKTILTSKFGAAAVTRGDEAGFTVKGLGDSTEAIGYVFQAISDAGLKPGADVKLALDVAASSFYDTKNNTYLFQGKSISTAEMIKYYIGLVEQYAGKILSIEDGLAENDWEGWTPWTVEMKERGVETIGDDLFVTQLPRLEKGIDIKAASAILIKVNQNGTMTGTLDVIKRSKTEGMAYVVSHRSGETLDDTIADLAYATGAFGLKTGDPQPEADFPDSKTWVRRRKYLRMIEIEKLDNN
ncbi:MAG: phosphopyruvate hydratase [Deltaproteobacteria bacterium]|nr:phosphopyruvate hydratase [Deltaproteobacteria bacterium]